MNKYFRTIQEALTFWGRKKQQLPPNNLAFKQAVLAKLSATRASALETKRHIPWLSLALGSMALIVLFVNTAAPIIREKTRRDVNYATPSLQETEKQSGNFRVSDSSTTDPSAPSKVPWYPWPSSEVPITDPRELLKTDYSATVRSRHVEELTNRIQTIVRGSSGRVDNTSSFRDHGSVSFAIPASKLEIFKAEIKSMVWAKFYMENISTQNLLPQKQQIEEQQASIEKQLGKLQQDQTALTDNHNKIIASIQTRLRAISKALAALRADGSNPAREAQLVSEDRNLRAQLANENSAYQSKLSELDQQIKAAGDQLEATKKQDQTLLDNVATVRGSIYISHIGILEAADLYTPGPLLFWALALLAILAYLYHRRRFTYKLP